MSNLEEMFILMLKDAGVREPIREYKFCPPRRFRTDMAWLREKVLVEIQGGIWIRGRHVRPAALASEYEKINLAQLLGYRILLFTPGMIKNGEALKTVQTALTIGVMENEEIIPV